MFCSQPRGTPAHNLSKMICVHTRGQAGIHACVYIERSTYQYTVHSSHPSTCMSVTLRMGISNSFTAEGGPALQKTGTMNSTFTRTENKSCRQCLSCQRKYPALIYSAAAMMQRKHKLFTVQFCIQAHCWFVNGVSCFLQYTE
jgi:hypothetical protein